MSNTIEFRTPSRLERYGLYSMTVAGVWMWILAHGIFTSLPSESFSHSASWIAGLSTNVMTLFWIALVIYHLGLFFIASRSIIVNEKNNEIDFAVMTIGMIGVICVIYSVIGYYYFQNNPITWFFNIMPLTLFYTGSIINASIALYYAFTE